MAFGVVKTWDNRQRKKGAVVMLPSGRSWTRRITWLEDENDDIKLKLEDGEDYSEVLVLPAFAQTVWQRFKDGGSIQDCLSILTTSVPKAMQSRREARKESE